MGAPKRAGQRINLSFGLKANDNRAAQTSVSFPGIDRFSYTSRSLFLFSSYVTGTQKISWRKSDIHISLAESWTYVTGLQRKEKRTRQGVRVGRRRERRKANAIKTARLKAIERGAQEVNLEQISIPTEQEGWMEPGRFWAWIREDLHSEWRGREWREEGGGSGQREVETESRGRATACKMIQSDSNYRHKSNHSTQNGDK